MLNIGFSEILLFGIIALVILGPEKLPFAVRTAGRWYARLRHFVNNIQHDIEKELQLSELREQMQQELSRIKSMEAQMQVQLNQMHQDIAELSQTTAHSSMMIYQPLDLQHANAGNFPYTWTHMQKILAHSNASKHVNPSMLKQVTSFAPAHAVCENLAQTERVL